ncbi:MAG: cytochrome c biogenesis protein ResB [Verrucomicrobiota bacterium]
MAQKDMGIYEAQEVFFSSWFMWDADFFYVIDGIRRDGNLPFPGGRLTMSVVFINLVLKLVKDFPVPRKRIGTFISHMGGLLLLLGGFITAYFSTEGGMWIPEGGKSGQFTDFDKVELAFIDESPEDYNQVTAFSGGYMKKGAVIEHEMFPGKITVEDFARHAEFVSRTGSVPSDYIGPAARFEVRRAKLEKEANHNRTAMMLRFEGFGAEDGVYLVFKFSNIEQTIDVGGKEYKLEIRQKHYDLPFEIALTDFKMEEHPGTRVARSYASDVVVLSEGTERKVEISMNKPLRKGPYTFYQSSFDNRSPVEATFLQVVENAGRNFPYISSIIMCIGLMVHMFLQIPRMISRKRIEKKPNTVLVEKEVVS